MADANSWPTTSIGLLNQLKNMGDSDAWDRFYCAYRPLVDRIGQRRGLQPADVEDVTQQVLIAVSRAISKFEYDPQRGQFRGWLATVTAHSVARRWRSLKRQGSIPDIELDLLVVTTDAECVDEFYEALLHTARQAVQAKVDTLEWVAFEQLTEHDKTAKQVAGQLAVSLSWVYRVKRKMMELLTQEVDRLSDDVAFIHK